MKNKVHISAKRDMGVLLALCLLQAVIAVVFLIKTGAVEAWGMIIGCAILVAVASLLGMRVGLTVDMENRVVIRRTLFTTRKIPFVCIKKVEIQKVFLGKAVVIIGDDGKVFDKTRFIFFKDNYISPEDFVAYFASGGSDRELLKTNEKLVKRVAAFSKIPLAIVAAIEIGLLVFMEIDQIPTYPIVDIKIYGYVTFWVGLVIALAAVIGLSLKNRHHAIAGFIFLVLYFGYAPTVLFAGFGTNEDYYVSYTDDFANYHDVFDDQWDGDYMHFPEEINGEVIDFSYYYKYYWDSIHEVYLEVKYSDEEFEQIYSEYAEKEESYFGQQYEEINLSEEYFSTDEYEGEVWIDHAYCKKILFDKANNTVIYYYLRVTDPFDLEWCKLVQRFDLDIFDYEEYVDAKRKENSEKVELKLIEAPVM